MAFLPATAQVPGGAADALAADTLPKLQIKLSYDLIPLGEIVFKEHLRSSQQGQALLMYGKYFFAVEAGQRSIRRDHSFDYTNTGRYFSLGPEINLLNKEKFNSFTFGLRFAHSTFSDELRFQLAPPFDDLTRQITNPRVRASWLELTSGLNVNVTRSLYMGYTVRLKFARSERGVGELIPYDVPGFGLYEHITGVGFSYYIGWVFPLWKPAPRP